MTCSPSVLRCGAQDWYALSGPLGTCGLGSSLAAPNVPAEGAAAMSLGATPAWRFAAVGHEERPGRGAGHGAGGEAAEGLLHSNPPRAVVEQRQGALEGDVTMNATSCSNLNHRRSAAPVRFCPQCGEMVNRGVAINRCRECPTRTSDRTRTSSAPTAATAHQAGADARALTLRPPASGTWRPPTRSVSTASRPTRRR